MYDGEFLSCDKLLLIDYKNGRCVMCDIKGEVLWEIFLLGVLWGVCFCGENEVFVILLDVYKVVVFDFNLFEIK